MKAGAPQAQAARKLSEGGANKITFISSFIYCPRCVILLPVLRRPSSPPAKLRVSSSRFTRLPRKTPHPPQRTFDKWKQFQVAYVRLGLPLELWSLLEAACARLCVCVCVCVCLFGMEKAKGTRSHVTTSPQAAGLKMRSLRLLHAPSRFSTSG